MITLFDSLKNVYKDIAYLHLKTDHHGRLVISVLFNVVIIFRK